MSEEITEKNTSPVPEIEDFIPEADKKVKEAIKYEDKKMFMTEEELKFDKALEALSETWEVELEDEK